MRKFLVCAALGSVLTFLTAYLSLYSSRVTAARDPFSLAWLGSPPMRFQGSYPGPFLPRTEFRANLFSMDMIHPPPVFDPLTFPYNDWTYTTFLYQVAAGWPFFAITVEADDLPTPPGQVPYAPPGLPWPAVRWRGFLADTAIFGFVIYAAVFARGHSRRARSARQLSTRAQH